MYKTLFAAILLVVFAPAGAEIYKHVGSNGEIIYSDRPEEGGEPVKLPGINSYTGSRGTQNRAGTNAVAREKAANGPYRSVRILQPSQDQTVQHNGGKVNVSLLLEPALRPGNGIRIIVNGFPKPEIINTTQFILADMNRGTNTLQIQVVGSNGDVLGESESVSFNIFQPSTTSAGSTPDGPSGGAPTGPVPGVPSPPGGGGI